MSPKKIANPKKKRKKNHEYCSLFLTIGAGSLIVMISAVWCAINMNAMAGFLGFLVFAYGMSYLALIILGSITMRNDDDVLGLIVLILFILVMTALVLFLLILFSIITGFSIGFNNPISNITSST